MATLTVVFNNISNDEFVEAMATQYNYADQVPKGPHERELVDNPQSKQDFVNEKIKEALVPTLKRGLQALAVKVAVAAAKEDKRDF